MVADEKVEDRLKAVSFAAGTAAFMACIERAVVVSVFVHWRVWAFLALNLLLLAILFTSKSQIQLSQIVGEDRVSTELKKRKKRRRQRSRVLVSIDGGCEIATLPEAASSMDHERKDEEDDRKKEEDYDELSEEELNQRVEDFIARFRQHLISDAKGTKVMGCTL